VIADLDERDLAGVAVGQGARVRLAAYPGETFAGTVTLVQPALDAESHTLQARIELTDASRRLRPGLYAEVELETRGAEGLAVPSDAVVDSGDLQYVFVARGGGRFEPRAVRLGARGDGAVEVLGGVSEGDAVVTTANFLVDSESRLRAAVEGFAAPAAAPASAASADARRPAAERSAGE
jgi:membrane fusion protein, copper/silver efflux system